MSQTLFPDGGRDPLDARRHIRIRADALAAIVREALIARGVPDAIAAVEADVMVDADLAGVPSHGVLMLPRLLKALREGRATAAPSVRVIRERGATCVMDGDLGPGRYTSTAAMDQAVERARAHGVGVCALVRSTHWGRAHAYACQAARLGFVGLCATNAIPTLAVEGAAGAVLGNNPLAIAVPRDGGRDPIVLDLAMSQAAFGKVATFQREGRAIPSGWGFAADGQPAVRPEAILESGLLAPMGGHKGLGLALMIELLTAALTDSPLGHEIAAHDRSGIDPGAAKLFVAVEAGAFGPPGAWARRVDAMIAHLHDAGLLAPGDRGWAARAAYLADGVPVHAGIVDQLAAEGVRLPAGG